jgi:diaminohydroxyphosphoribosylaminopyrimidine deaminase / 5-amino-6-(5-phosphoribosylamino)uracil reductase
VTDETLMRRALELAERGRGATSPNPMVGAVLAAAGEVVGEGYHRRAGAPHAEIEALGHAGARARGATLYVTLEPCNHAGRTPPCVPEIVAAGVTRVVVAVADPNPFVAGRGAAALLAAGVLVEVGLLGEEAERQNGVFLTAMRERRPHVTLKAAMTADGKIADVHGVSKWITGELARAHVQRLRHEADAIVVGAITALRDDPALTVRLAETTAAREPWRVVLDGAARLAPDARLIRAATAARALVAVGPGADPARVAALAAAGATVLRLPAHDGRIDIVALLAELFAREVRGVLVEGGGEVHAAFLDAGVVDRVALFIAPMLLGGRDAPTAVGGAGRDLKNAVRLARPTVTILGDDVLLEADVVRDGG